MPSQDGRARCASQEPQRWTRESPARGFRTNPREQRARNHGNMLRVTALCVEESLEVQRSRGDTAARIRSVAMFQDIFGGLWCGALRTCPKAARDDRLVTVKERRCPAKPDHLRFDSGETTIGLRASAACARAETTMTLRWRRTTDRDRTASSAKSDGGPAVTRIGDRTRTRGQGRR
jgi:hypothetical protein